MKYEETHHVFLYDYGEERKQEGKEIEQNRSSSCKEVEGSDNTDLRRWEKKKGSMHLCKEIRVKKK